jgi:hypothetical protein
MSFLWGQRRDKDDDSSCSDDEISNTQEDDDAFVQTSSSSLPVIQSNNPSTTPSTRTSNPLSPMTWVQAHRLACMKYNSLKVTQWQIESQFPVGQEIPVPDDLLIEWKDATIIEQLVTLLRPSPELTASASPSSWWSVMIRGLWTFVRRNNEEEGSEDEEEEPPETRPTDSHEEWIHPALARSLLENLASILKSQSHDIVPLSSLGKEQSEATTEEQTLLRHLPIDEVKVLCQVLERTKVPVSVQTTPSNECVLVSGSSKDVATRLVEYDLQRTAQRLEQESTALEEQAKKYRAAALAAKRCNRNPLPSMKLYKLCESQLAHKQQHLLQITTLQMTLRQAVHNRSMVQAMGSARTVLRDINEELEDVHDVMDDLKEALQDQEETNAALLQSTMEADEEDELLRELQRLTLDDEINGDPPNDKKDIVVASLKPVNEKYFVQKTTDDAIAVVDDRRIVDNLISESEVNDDKNGVELSPVPIKS